ncbi:unnamed protein product [Bursaphelenchus xylophilus]|uniref:(pine wood nematode) hypothetical protein n=1 Tax=Bursaphelenchus xylophilus TaxID=6326 RepID=A0A1I7RUQ9_BURXY|nr:unnamed protein product [Bursaphelenchus xylophilus]CAG9114334.1 unnamed protein product [Bursaphelenchus xylophilus]
MLQRFRACSIILSLALLSPAQAAIELTRNGCGETKGCLFRPSGCDPMVDCTIGMIFYVSGPNELTVQLTATSLMPQPQLQYIAVGYSHDSVMGDDYVVECVLSPKGGAFNEVEVFTSYNEGKSNDRTYLNSTENAIIFSHVEGQVVDGRISCQFSQQIVPQMESKNGRIWSLNSKYYIFGATGSAQPDEINAHDTSRGSFYYPIISNRAINPALIGERVYDLPEPFPEPKKAAEKAEKKEEAKEPENSATTGTLALTTLFMAALGYILL